MRTFSDAVRIQLASELHLEFSERRFPASRIIEPAHRANILLIGGDILNGTEAVALVKDCPVHADRLPGVVMGYLGIRTLCHAKRRHGSDNATEKESSLQHARRALKLRTSNA